MSHANGLFDGLCDDAAVFPPGNLALAEAVTAHHEHQRSRYAALVGSLVVAGHHLEELSQLVGTGTQPSLVVSVVVPLSGIAATFELTDTHPAITLAGIEVALPPETDPATVVPLLDEVVRRRRLTCHIEVPRDPRRDRLIEALSGADCRAKLRTGGVHADLYPDEKELAEALVALVRAGVPFKATAGLHHAVRRTDPDTDFEQHGFLNLMVATAAARVGAGTDDLVEVLADRDPAGIAAAAGSLTATVRDSFGSFGTCSITDPVEELVALGLLDLGLADIDAVGASR
ncbi:hypothetical protein [Nocardioides limicola]|uniref:hypothetical protein n=1 Tax=Nocardioides limicola TaxID=2803368 RepID=UPI001EEFDBE9|nr:hypothetical protein [Nocardioides sp. DJM-14]